MLTVAFLLAVLAIPLVLRLYFDAPNEVAEEEYIPDGR